MKVLTHNQAKELAKLRESKKARHDAQEVLVLGKKICQELPQGLVKQVYSSEKNKTHCYTSDSLMQKLWGLKHPEGFAAKVKMPPYQLPKAKERWLILDTINDPGNLGTLIRSALGFGFDGVFLIGGCDPYNEKSLRAAKGATFKLKLGQGSAQDLLLLSEELNWPLLAADAKGKPIKKIQAPKHFALIMGSESHGLTPELAQAATLVAVPIKNLESLNVAIAGALLMYELQNG